MPTIETNTRRIVKRLTAEGWVHVGGSKHDKYDHPAKPGVTITVPRHRTQSTGVAPIIATAAGWI